MEQLCHNLVTTTTSMHILKIFFFNTTVKLSSGKVVPVHTRTGIIDLGSEDGKEIGRMPRNEEVRGSCTRRRKLAKALCLWYSAFLWCKKKKKNPLKQNVGWDWVFKTQNAFCWPWFTSFGQIQPYTAVLRGIMGGVYIHVWTRVIVGIVESESTPKEEQFQVGRREQRWPPGPLLSTWKFLAVPSLLKPWGFGWHCCGIGGDFFFPF